jgi:hypothetical protein
VEKLERRVHERESLSLFFKSRKEKRKKPEAERPDFVFMVFFAA